MAWPNNQVHFRRGNKRYFGAVPVLISILRTQTVINVKGRWPEAPVD